MTTPDRLNHMKKCISKNENYLYHTDGEVLSSKGKYISCEFILTTSNFYVLRQDGKSSSDFKVKHNLSFLDIDSINFVDQNTRIFECFGQKVRIYSENMDELEENYTSQIERLNWNSAALCSVKYNSYPEGLPNIQTPKTRPDSISIYRYLAICRKFDINNDPTVKQVLIFFEKTNKTSISFDATINQPPYPECIYVPLVTEPNLSYVNFNAFAPDCINYILGNLLKRSKNISCISLSNYTTLDPFAIGFATAENPPVVSWKFENCFQDSERFITFFTEFSKYQGDIQTLIINGVNLNIGVVRRMCTFFKAARCFVNLEVFQLNNLTSSHQNTYELYQIVEKTMQSLPRLVNLSCSQWQPAIEITNVQLGKPYEFTQCANLRHLHLAGINLTENQGSLQLPPNLVELDVYNATFTSTSLIAFLRSIKEFGKNIAINIGRISMRDSDWFAFFRDCPSLEPLTNVTELNYSSNKMQVGFENQLIRLFISPTLKFLALSNIFTPENVQQLNTIVEALQKIELYGLEIQGGKSKKLNDDVLELFPKLKKIKTLEYLDIQHHAVSDKGTSTLFKTIKTMKLLHEVLIDGTANQSRTNFYLFYGQIWLIKTIRAIQLPTKDWDRILQSSLHTSEFVQDRFIRWYDAMLTKMHTTTPFVRTEFYRTGRKIAELQNYANNFPISLIIPTVYEHMWQFPWFETAMCQRSLCDKEFLPTDDFAERQITSITSPFLPPTFEGPANLIIPQKLRRQFGVEQIHVHRVIEEVKDDNQIFEQIREDFVKKYAGMIKDSTIQLLQDVDAIADFFKQNESEETDLVSSLEVPEPESYINNAELMFFQHELAQINAIKQSTETGVHTTQFSTNLTTTMDDSIFEESGFSKKRSKFVIKNTADLSLTKLESIESALRKNNLEIKNNEGEGLLLDRIENGNVFIDENNKKESIKKLNKLTELNNILMQKYNVSMEPETEENNQRLKLPQPYPIHSFALDENILGKPKQKRIFNGVSDSDDNELFEGLSDDDNLDENNDFYNSNVPQPTYAESTQEADEEESELAPNVAAQFIIRKKEDQKVEEQAENDNVNPEEFNTVYMSTTELINPISSLFAQQAGNTNPSEFGNGHEAGESSDSGEEPPELPPPMSMDIPSIPSIPVVTPPPQDEKSEDSKIIPNNPSSPDSILTLPQVPIPHVPQSSDNLDTLNLKKVQIAPVVPKLNSQSIPQIPSSENILANELPLPKPVSPIIPENLINKGPSITNSLENFNSLIIPNKNNEPNSIPKVSVPPPSPISSPSLLATQMPPSNSHPSLNIPTIQVPPPAIPTSTSSNELDNQALSLATNIPQTPKVTIPPPPKVVVPPSLKTGIPGQNIEIPPPPVFAPGPPPLATGLPIQEPLNIPPPVVPQPSTLPQPPKISIPDTPSSFSTQVPTAQQTTIPPIPTIQPKGENPTMPPPPPPIPVPSVPSTLSTTVPSSLNTTLPSAFSTGIPTDEQITIPPPPVIPNNSQLPPPIVSNIPAPPPLTIPPTPPISNIPQNNNTDSSLLKTTILTPPVNIQIPPPHISPQLTTGIPAPQIPQIPSPNTINNNGIPPIVPTPSPSPLNQPNQQAPFRMPNLPPIPPAGQPQAFQMPSLPPVPNANSNQDLSSGFKMPALPTINTPQQTGNFTSNFSMPPLPGNQQPTSTNVLPPPLVPQLPPIGNPPQIPVNPQLNNFESTVIPSKLNQSSTFNVPNIPVPKPQGQGQ